MFTLIMGGCVVIPLPDTGEIVEPEQQQSLVGVSLGEAEQILGSPHETFTFSNKSYRLYKTTRQEHYLVLVHPYVLIWALMGGKLLPPVFTDSESLETQCVLLELEGPTVTWAEAGTAEENPDCLALIKNNQKIIGELRQWVSERIEAKDYATAFQNVRKLKNAESMRAIAQAGYLPAVVELAVIDGGDTGPLRELALSGNVDAAVAVARYFHDISPLSQIAQSGNSAAQYAYAEHIDAGDPERLMWYCKAAAQRHSGAIARVAGFFAAGTEGLRVDPVVAYAWMLVAVEHGYEATQDRCYEFPTEKGLARCGPLIEKLANELDANQLSEARAKASAWTPTDCPAY